MYIKYVSIVWHLVCNQVDGETQMTKSTRSADAMKIGFRRLGEVEIDHHVDGLDVDSCVYKMQSGGVVVVVGGTR